MGALGQRDVPDFPLARQLEGVDGDGVAREGLKGERGDELRGVPGHDDVDGSPPLDAFPRQLGGLVGRNAAGHPEDDCFPLHPHCPR